MITEEFHGRNCGVYMLRHPLSTSFYIGASEDLSRRSYQHRRWLINNTHHCKRLQLLINEFGLEGLTMTLIIACRKTELLSYEDAVIKKFEPDLNAPLEDYQAAGKKGGTNAAKKLTKEQASARGKNTSLGLTREERSVLGRRTIIKTIEQSTPEERSVRSSLAGSLRDKSDLKRLSSKGGRASKVRAIVNITTGEVFKNKKVAAAHYGVSGYAIRQLCLGKKSYTYPHDHVFKYQDEL